MSDYSVWIKHQKHVKRAWQSIIDCNKNNCYTVALILQITLPFRWIYTIYHTVLHIIKIYEHLNIYIHVLPQYNLITKGKQNANKVQKCNKGVFSPTCFYIASIDMMTWITRTRTYSCFHILVEDRVRSSFLHNIQQDTLWSISCILSNYEKKSFNDKVMLL